MRLFVTTFFITFLMVNSIFAETLLVPEKYKTIQSAIDSSSTGDTVLVAPGIYVENVHYHGKGIVLASHFLTSNDTSYISKTIIDGNGDSSAVSIQDREPAGVELIGFSIRNGLGKGDWPNVRGGGINIGYGGSPLIRYCYIYNNEAVGNSNRGAGINTKGSSAVISNCKIFNNTSSTAPGINVGNGGSGVLIDSCEIFENYGNYPVMTGYTEDVTIRRTVIRHNDGGGIRIYSTNNAHLLNSTIFKNDGYGIILSGVNASVRDTLYVTNSIVYANADTNIIADDSLFVVNYSLIENGKDKFWFNETCLDEDPLFADSLGYLSPDSPVIDAGDPSLAYDPDNTITDMGAHYYKQPTAISENHINTIKDFELEQNYPNPFNPETQISYQLNTSGKVKLEVFNALGQKVVTLINKSQKSGNYKILFNGQSLASGIYYYRLSINNQMEVRKMVLMK